MEDVDLDLRLWIIQALLGDFKNSVFFNFYQL